MSALVLAFPILFYLLLTVPSLIWLAKRELDPVAQAVWALTVVAVPIMGAIALTIVSPGRPRTSHGLTEARKEFELEEFRRQ
jgi:hypothetical protein